MKFSLFQCSMLLGLHLWFAPHVGQAQSSRPDNTILLDKTGVQNLRIQTVTVQERTFEKTVFAIGRVEEIPSHRYSISSRIPGRALEVHAFVGDHVTQDQVLIEVESRQPGDPPPTISLTAARDGLVVGSHVLPGQPVQPDQDLFDISDRSEVWVVARIPEQVASLVHIGTRARITFPALAGDPVVAKLIRFGVQADKEAGTVDGIFQIPNPSERLQPGMRAEFSIIVDTRSNVLAVPEESVQGDPARRVVYLKDFELLHAFVKSPVVLGEKGAGWVEVLAGVFPGDEVVTQGSYLLGFASGSGMSLKEALDSAHGHEHNPDGSEMTEQQRRSRAKAVKQKASGGAPDESGAWVLNALKIYALFVSFIAAGLGQWVWRFRRQEHANKLSSKSS